MGPMFPTRRSTPRRLGAAIAATLPLLWGAAATFIAMPAGAQAQAVQTYRIPAGPLTETLNRFGREAGILLSFSTDLTAGLNSPGVDGRFAVADALRALLAGSGLVAEPQPNGGYLLRRAPAAADGVVALPTVRVGAGVEDALSQEGRAADGYRASTASAVGPLGRMALRDAPFAISVVPRELLLNIQAQSPDDLYRINPSTVSQVPQITGWAPMVKIRGFSSYDRAEDGMRRSYGYATSLEDKERVEVINGLTGFLFGAAAPGGMVNYVNKRPTAERYHSVTVGDYGGGQFYLHGDAGGRIDDGGRVGYRVNVVRQQGDTAVDDQEIERSLVSAALDWQATERLGFEFNAAYSDYRMTAPTAYWTFREGVRRISAPDASKNWGQPWIEDRIENRKLMAKATYQVSDHLTLRAAWLRDEQERPKQDHTMNSVRSTTEYYQIRIHSGHTESKSDARQLLADLTFDTGPVEHKVTAGYYGYGDRSWGTTYSPNTGYLGPNGFDAPTPVPEPVWPAKPDDALYRSGHSRNHNFVIGDTLRFNERWSALVGVNHSRIESRSRAASGALNQPDYEKARNSPSFSLVYQPLNWVTTYATHIEGLEQGGVAPPTAVNGTRVMAPMVSRQQELGLKLELGGVLLSAALFDIEKAYEYTNTDNVYVQDGRQRHRGGEVSVFGKATEQLTLFGGVTVLTARVDGGSNDGNAPMNVPKVVAKLYAEYALAALPGVSLTGGVYHVGKQWATNTNTSRLPSYTTADIGARYETRLADKPLSLRLNVNNATGRDYWLNSYYLGAPRSVALSAQLQF